MTHCPGATTLLLRWPAFCLWNVYLPGLHSLRSVFLPALPSLSQATPCPRSTSRFWGSPHSVYGRMCSSLSKPAFTLLWLTLELCEAKDPHLVAHPKGLTQDLGHNHLLTVFPTPPPSGGAPDLEALISNRASSPPTRQRLSGFPAVCRPDVAVAQEGALLPLGLPLAPCYPASPTLWL